jgi:hypothetical protein
MNSTSVSHAELSMMAETMGLYVMVDFAAVVYHSICVWVSES